MSNGVNFMPNDFNPRTREGCDLLSRYIAHDLIGISIHAPARGATVYKWEKQNVVTISIHAPARGATIWAKTMELPATHFNPRTREGCDPGKRKVRFL